MTKSFLEPVSILLPPLSLPQERVQDPIPESGAYRVNPPTLKQRQVRRTILPPSPPTMSSITLKTWYTLMVIFALATLPQITQAASPCSSGYTLTLYNGYCVCKHGNSIVYPNPACTYTEDKNSCTATCPTGTASRRRRQVPQVLFNDDGSISNCPHGLVSCPISDSPESRHECVNVKSDLYNCGGCAATGKGVVCGDKRGVRAASCDAGQCRIHSCRSGYYLDSHTHTCVHKH